MNMEKCKGTICVLSILDHLMTFSEVCTTLKLSESTQFFFQPRHIEYALEVKKMSSGPVFFSGYIPHNPLKKVTVERFLKFQVLLTSSWDRFRRKIPGEKRKFRRAARAGHNSRGGKNKRKSFLILVSSDQRPHRGVFRPERVFSDNFAIFMLICTQKCDSWEIKKWSRR